MLLPMSIPPARRLREIGCGFHPGPIAVYAVCLSVAGPVSAAVVAAPLLRLSPILSAGVSRPVQVIPVPGRAGHYLVAEQEGRIVRVEGGHVMPSPFADLRASVAVSWQGGLLGAALHPKFTRNGRYFVAYTQRSEKLSLVVAERKRDVAGERVLLRIPVDGTQNGGHLVFDSAGRLYIGVGAGECKGDDSGNGQRLDDFRGKILRIDVDRGDPYGIPPDNPFPRAKRPEIFALGLRNPWRFGFDRATGKLYAADAGQDRREEINLVRKGANYGWNLLEGTLCFRPAEGCDRKGMEPPLVEFPAVAGGAVIGGGVYRGKAIAELKGTYLYADFASGRIWGVHLEGPRPPTPRLLLETRMPVVSFAEESDGEMLVVSHHGGFYRIIRGGR